MSRFDDGNSYEDVFVFEDLVYTTVGDLGVVHLYRNRNNSLIKLHVHDVRYPCKCKPMYLVHSIVVTKDHIIQCCAVVKLVSVLDRYGEQLRTIRMDDIPKSWPGLCQTDVEGNFLIADRMRNRLFIANAYQPKYQWSVVDLADLSGSGDCGGAVWFRHRLYVVSRDHLLTFTPVN